MRTPLFVVLAFVVLLPCGAVEAEPPAPMADRVVIFDVEMRRGPASALTPYLGQEAHPLSRSYATRALGRIGTDDPKAISLLADLLAKAPAHLGEVLAAAGMAQSKDLSEPIQAHLTHKDAAIVAAAAEALGWTGDAGAAPALTKLFLSTDAGVRRGALLGVARLRAEGLLERVVAFTQDADASVRAAADFACWRLAGARKQAGTAVDKDWDGDAALVPWFTALLDAGDAERRMAGLRPLASLLPKTLSAADEDHVAVLARIDDPDPRVVQDLLWRIVASREGPAVRAVEAKALAHADPKVRHLAAEGLGKRGDDPAAAALVKRYGVEEDPRLREVLAVEALRCGTDVLWKRLQEDTTREASVEAPLRDLTVARVLLLDKTEGACAALFAWLATGERHALVWMTVLGELAEREDPSIASWLATQQTLLLPATPGADAFVMAALLECAAAHLSSEAWGRILEAHDPALRDLIPDEVRQAFVTACGERLGKEGCPPEQARAMKEALALAMYGDRSAWVREAARKAATKAGLPDVPKRDPHQPNGWRGLPRPTTPILGLPLHDGAGAWLSPEEILRLADAIHAQDVQVAFKTTQGLFRVALDADAAPAHAASLALAVHAGLYADTRWHRVVPNFVIQGGDPHGHGAGSGGWTVPDEITARSYQRGVLGMPKSTKDDGGCQLFFMHTGYVPLDGRYTAYGHVVSGMETVDAIRVGDRIVGARFVLP